MTPLLSDIANDPHGPLLWPDTALLLWLLLGHVWPSTFTGMAKSQGNARRRKQLMCFKTILSHGSVTPPWTPASTPLQLIHLEDCKDYWVNRSVGISEITSTELHTIELGNRQYRQLHRKFQTEFSSQITFSWSWIQSAQEQPGDYHVLRTPSSPQALQHLPQHSLVITHPKVFRVVPEVQQLLHDCFPILLPLTLAEDYL